MTGLYTVEDSPGDVWIGWFGIDPRWRGAGMGHALLRATIEMARGSGYETLRLWTATAPAMADAEKLYRSQGFVHETTGRLYDDYDVLIFSRSVNDGAAAPIRAASCRVLAGAMPRKLSTRG